MLVNSVKQENAVIDFDENVLPTPKPFVKWVGGKRSIINELISRMPKNYIAYNEVFSGGAALFYAICPTKAYLYDVNYHLICTYTSIRDNLEEVIKELHTHNAKHEKSHFLKIRLEMAIEENPIKVAANLIYLNKTCYNGLYRVNKSGAFNVPMGTYERPRIIDEPNLRAVSKVLQGIEIKHQSFKKLKPKKNEFYYMDPPYHKTFSSYAEGGFGDEAHEKLAYKCKEIHKAGGYFMLSNSDTDFIRDLYKEFKIEDIMAGRYVSCKSNQRGKKSEFLIRNY